MVVDTAVVTSSYEGLDLNSSSSSSSSSSGAGGGLFSLSSDSGGGLMACRRFGASDHLLVVPPGNLLWRAKNQTPVHLYIGRPITWASALSMDYLGVYRTVLGVGDPLYFILSPLNCPLFSLPPHLSPFHFSSPPPPPYLLSSPPQYCSTPITIYTSTNMTKCHALSLSASFHSSNSNNSS